MLIKRNDVFINPSLKLLKYITKKKNHIKKPPTKPHQKLNINPPPLREPPPPTILRNVQKNILDFNILQIALILKAGVDLDVNKTLNPIHCVDIEIFRSILQKS